MSNKRVSAYLVTISTNQRPKESELNSFGENFNSHIEKLFSTKKHYKDDEGFVEYFDYGSAHLIDEVKVKSTIEMGENPHGGRIHAHVIVKIRHHTKIRKLLKSFIQEYLQDKMGINTYVTIKFAHANIDSMKIYINKTLDE